MKRTARLSILLAGCWVLVMAAAGCAEMMTPQQSRGAGRSVVQPHPLAVLVEEGLAERCTAADNPDWSHTNEKDPSQNYYLRCKNNYIRNKALVVDTRMADRKEPPITLELRDLQAQWNLIYRVYGFTEDYLETQGFAVRKQSPYNLEPPDYLLKLDLSGDARCKIYSGQGKLLYTMPWHRNASGLVLFLKAKMIKGELDLKSEKYDALIDSVRHSEVGQDEQALALLNKAVELDGSFLLARRERCKFFLAKSRWDDAIKEISEILALSLSDPKVRLAWYRERGNLYYWTEAFDAALKDFEQVLAMDPRNADAFAGKGWALLEKNELGKAADAFEFALALDPDNLGAIGGRGWVLAKRQKYAEALKDFDRLQAAKKRSTRGHVYCYKMLGEKEKARAALADVFEGAATWPKTPLFERYKAELQEWAKELE